jgi:hypothetical protein
MAAMNDGGPAFPKDGSAYVHDGAASGVRSQEGKSLRDYFAAQALQRYSPDFCASNEMNWADLAAACYGVADAMLKAREAKR